MQDLEDSLYGIPFGSFMVSERLLDEELKKQKMPDECANYRLIPGSSPASCALTGAAVFSAP
jgi:hypothetical protein